MTTIQNVTDNYFSLWKSVDHRVDNWLLMSSYKPMITMIIVYCGVVSIGPKLMTNRKPFQVASMMVAYNFLLAGINSFVCFQYISIIMKRKSPWICYVEPSITTDVEDLKILATTHMLLLTKPLELFDTLFFILRKKENQLTFLHVYHHSATLAFGWAITRWIPNDITYLGCFLNAIIHVMMYCYYALSALGPSVQKYLWWKKYLTSLQIIQFVLGILIEIGIIVTGCSANMWLHYVFILYVVSLLLLFSKFYQKTYKHKNL